MVPIEALSINYPPPSDSPSKEPCWRHSCNFRFSYYITYLIKTYDPINYVNPCYQMKLEEFAKRNNSILIDSLISAIDNPMLVISGAVGM